MYILEYDDSKKKNVILREMLSIRVTHPALYSLVDQIKKIMTQSNTNNCFIIKMNLSKVKNFSSVNGLSKYYRAFLQNINGAYSILNNSSIWIRLVDVGDCEAEANAIAEFKYFKEIGLYDYKSAWENLEYNIRIQRENYLDSTTTQKNFHGAFVTPVLYGDECEFQQILEGNKKTL